ncbi:hypothetical protein AYO21_10067 [Fonsecaea monophora]|uniref:Uncharacterized protein n=1 Tax=Fonsecaea monophora TaxID=254056 RepID=A0A177EWU6_9EURO|nr:hypothetical protein AYO21_10067 [Fonsecaea monophora]OAG35750.1 hypothetical protein AYO21_10067 [Fonsecaea monophora]
MGGKARVRVVIRHRDEFSHGDSRKQLGQAAYHWGILIQPKNPKGFDSNVYDVTDATVPDPITRVDLNPNHDWRIRSKMSVNPMHSGRLLGRVMIGKVPSHITIEGIDDILRQVPLPIKSSTPVQNCVNWVLAAIEVMQKQGLAEAFDVD